MIRLVDIRGQDIGYHFSFWDTTTDMYIEVGGHQAWDTRAEFEADFNDKVRGLSGLDRFTSLMPEWTEREGTLDEQMSPVEG